MGLSVPCVLRSQGALTAPTSPLRALSFSPPATLHSDHTPNYPPPGTYDSKSSLGEQMLSTKETLSAIGFGSASRDEISSMTKAMEMTAFSENSHPASQGKGMEGSFYLILF